MVNKCNTVEQTCGTTNYATCIEFQGTTNENSPLKNDCKLSVEETTQDIYTQLEEINLSELGESCLEYILDADNKIIVKNVLLKYEEEICNLKQQVETLQDTALCDTSVEGCDLNFGSLVDQCNQVPTTLKATLQLILDTIQP